MGLKESQKKYIQNNREKRNKYQLEHYHKNKNYINSKMAVRRYNKKIEAGEELTEKQKLLFKMHKENIKKYLENKENL